MTGIWKRIVGMLEAKSVADYKEDIFRYVTRRHGEHAADELRNSMRSLPFKEFKRHVAVEYMDSKLDELVDTMAQKAILAYRAKQGKDAPQDTPGRSVAPSGRTFTDLGDADERQARIDAMRQARQASPGGKAAAQTLLTPSRTGRHAVGSAGQNQPKQQPSVAAGVVPQKITDPLRKNATPSGVVRAQREVDKETREKGVAAGERLAKQLGVPTTAERTTEHPDTGEKRIQIWGPDRVFKHMASEPTLPPGTYDPVPVAGERPQDQGPWQSGKKLPPTSSRSDVERKSQSHQRAVDAAANRIDPDRLEKIKRGLLKRNAAPTKVGPDRPGSFHGERWKPHGREEEVPVSRPDAASGNWVRGKHMMNPKHTGVELIWNKHIGEWQQPSVFASKEAERGAKLKSQGAGLRQEPSSAPSQDFGDEPTQSDFSSDDDRTDPDAKSFPDD